MQHRPQQSTARCAGSANKGIRQTVLDHHSRKIVRSHHDCAAIRHLDLAVAPDPFQPPAENRKLGGFFGIDDRHMVQTYGFPLGDFRDGFTASEKDRYAELTLVKKLRRLYHTGQLAVRKNNPLGMSPNFLKN